MGSNVSRWLKYAKAKLDDTVGSANQELDDREAARAAEVADRPWLASDGDAPTLDEVRAKIEAQAARADGGPGPVPAGRTTTPDGQPITPSSWDPIPSSPPSATPGSADAAPTTAAPDGGAAAPRAETTPTGDDLRSVAEAAEQSQAKLELEERTRRSAERLDQIRRELGVDAPPGPEA